ncbi:MAG: hypothetical protein ABXS93_05735 [Sulfurimonas sp.]
MMKFLSISTLIALFITGCSFATPHDAWRYKSTNSFSSYQENFLSDNDVLAKNDLQRAVKSAKKSAQLEQLASIYLGKCALNISVGIDDKCQEYTELRELVEDKGLDSYYHLLVLEFQDMDPLELPQEYREFALELKQGNSKDAADEVMKIEKITSMLVAASLISDFLSHDDKKTLLDKASEYGYKKSVVFWLKQMKKTAPKNDRRLIEKRLEILK